MWKVINVNLNIDSPLQTYFELMQRWMHDIVDSFTMLLLLFILLGLALTVDLVLIVINRKASFELFHWRFLRSISLE